jgi:hypothetical protein
LREDEGGLEREEGVLIGAGAREATFEETNDAFTSFVLIIRRVWYRGIGKL